MSVVVSAAAQAKFKIAAGEFDDAKRVLERALAANATDPILLEQLGLIAYHAGDHEEAVRRFREAVRLDPALDDARIKLLGIVVRGEDRPAAASMAAEAIAAGTEHPRVLALAAKAFKRNREFARAGEIWRRLARSQEGAQPLVEAAECLTRAKDFRAAYDCAKAAVERDPTAEKAWLLQLQALDKGRLSPTFLGEAIRGLASVNAAAALDHLPALISNGLHDVLADLIVACSRQGARVDPILLSSLTKTLQNIARRAEADRDFDKAGRFWKLLLSFTAADKEAAGGLRVAIGALITQARNATDGGHYAEASRLFRAVTALDPENQKAFRDLASLLERSEQWEEAAQVWFQYAKRLGPGDCEAAALRGAKSTRKLSSLEVQLRLLKLARSIDPKGSEIREWGDRVAIKLAKAAVVRLEDGAVDEAVRQVIEAGAWGGDADTISAAKRKIVGALRTKMVEADKRGDWKEAGELGRIILTVDPTRVQALRLLARSAYRERRLQEASDLYARLIELEPLDERHYAKLGRIYRNLRLYDRGLPLVMRLLELHPDHPQGRQLLSEMLMGQQQARMNST